ncbi:hypothetical protein LPJ61_006487, partial [Coemansia biformis]
MTPCPGFNYNGWAAEPHSPLSTGPLRIPSMRPPPACITFISTAVEQVIRETSQSINDPDIRQLFANIMPNTLDTAIAWHVGETSGWPYTFVVAGDINAQWTCDSTNQLLPLVPYMDRDIALQRLIAGLINMQAEQIAQYPFANAYKPPVHSGLKPAENGWAQKDTVDPPFDPRFVFEA